MLVYSFVRMAFPQVLLRHEQPNEGKRTAINLKTVVARGRELLYRAADELPVKNRCAGIVAYNNSRAMRA